MGPFAFQGNNDTRAFEYPWAFASLDVRPGLQVLEIGGSLSGLQFVLDRSGCHVINVDPATDSEAFWPLDRHTFDLLNRRFGTRVVLKQSAIESADLPSDHFDRVVSVSVIEHIAPREITVLLEHVRRVLRPGGLFVATVDLFLDLDPFTKVDRNKFGINMSIESLVKESGLQMMTGERSELLGFPEFDAARILRQRDRYYVGNGWPCMVQAFVLSKTG